MQPARVGIIRGSQVVRFLTGRVRVRTHRVTMPVRRIPIPIKRRRRNTRRVVCIRRGRQGTTRNTRVRRDRRVRCVKRQVVSIGGVLGTRIRMIRRPRLPRRVGSMLQGLLGITPGCQVVRCLMGRVRVRTRRGIMRVHRIRIPIIRTLSRVAFTVMARQATTLGFQVAR